MHSRKPLIAQVTGYYPPNVGGVEQRVKKLSELLVDAGYKVYVFTSSTGSRPHTSELEDNLKVYYLRYFGFASTPIMPSLLFRLMRLPRNSIVHLHVYHAFTPEMVYLMSKLKRIPYVAHVRIEMMPEGRFGFLLKFYKKRVLAIVLRHADRVICLTDDYADLMKNNYGVAEKNISVIPNATDFEISTEPKVALHSPVRLLFVGRLVKQKNVSTLIDAINVYQKKYGSSLHLDIVGDGELKRDIKKQITCYKLTKAVTLRGVLHGEELQKTYAASDIFVFPTLYESFGSVYIEAMSKGLPIVTSKIDAVRNVVKERRNGLLVKPNADDFCEAIYLMISERELYKSISQNNITDIQIYRWSNILKETQQIYEGILKTRSRTCND
jgi:glycosyltransferase involved in cell wall biosynthesis